MPTQPSLNRDPIGTTYLAPNGSIWRLRKYEVPFRALVEDLTGPEHEVPLYDYFSADGGASGGLTDLPEGSVRIVMPPVERPAEGTIWVTSDGTIYMLRDYSVDLAAEPYTGEPDKPSYKVMLSNKGGFTTAYTLPDDARIVWTPNPEN